MRTLARKLSSRKLWVSIIGFCVAVGSAFCDVELDNESVTLIASGCAALCAYVIGEGIADASRSSEQKKDNDK